MPEAEKMESGEQVEFVHQVQIFLSVLSSVLDCEDSVLRGIRPLAGEFCDDAARGFAGNRADAGYFLQMQAAHTGMAGEVVFGVNWKNHGHAACGCKMVCREVEDFPVGEAGRSMSCSVSSFFGSLKGVVEIWRVGENKVVSFAAVR